MANHSKFQNMTVLEKERESKRRAFEEGEMVDAMGQISDQKARPEVRRYFNQLEAEENGYRDEAYQIMTEYRRDRKKYNAFLEAVFSRFLEQEDIPKRFHVYAKSNDKGLIVGIKNTNYVSAFESCGLPPYDYYACKTRAVQIGNTVAKLMGYTRQTEAGVLIADAEDLKKYGRQRTY